MNIKQLKYVCAIVDAGSFSAAAAREGVSVQAVSKAMAELEGRVGTPLFERMSSGVRPTPFGRVFAARAGRVLEEWDALEHLARVGSAALAGDGGPFRMGFCCPSFPGVDKFSALIALVSRKVLRREVTVSLLEGTDAVDSLLAGRIDGLISIGSVRAEGIVCGSLGTVASCALMAADHPLAARESVTLDDLAAYPVLVSERFDHFNDSVLRIYLERGLRSELVPVSSAEELEVFFARGGVSFMVAGNLVTPSVGLVTRPIAQPDEVAVPICLSTPRGSGLTDYVEFRHALAGLGLFS